MRTTVVEHPLVWNLLTLLRDESTPNASFRAALHDLTAILIYEALREAPVRRFALQTPVAETEGIALANPPLLVPVLRAGLGMVSAATGLIPNAQVGFVGIARDEDTHRPVPYWESLPEDLSQTPVVILDPMVATGGSLRYAVELLAERKAVDITAVCVVGAPEGIRALEKSGLPLRLVAAAVDDGLNENAYIVPGLGDAGDRQFGPR